MVPAGRDDLVYACGQSEIDLGRRELRIRGVVSPLGGRAFEILKVLVESAGRLVTKDDFMDQVWPGTTVGDNALQVHIAAIRNALASDRDLLKTVAGRGYRLIGTWTPVRRTELHGSLDRAAGTPPLDPVAHPIARLSHNLPVRLTEPVGREAALSAISALLMTERFVSIIGPGGIGKTTVAVTAARALLHQFDGAACFVDLGPVGDPSLAAFAIASALGVAVRAEDPILGITNFLRDRKMLLVLDSCEHLIDAIAAIAERINRWAPLVHILTTSREALRVEGERVHTLAPLEFPSAQAGLTASEALGFSAVQCFVRRAVAADSAFVLTDANAPVVAGICRTLDGVALAIELAAGRVAMLGVPETARLLEGQIRLHLRGRRTAIPRHQTLAAALDWSHALLSDAERVVLRRISIFVGAFITLEPAQAVATGEDAGESTVVDAIAGLLAKSLITADFSGPAARYRLLDTTRAYALEKLAESGEAALAARRHALWFRDFLARENAGTQERMENVPSGDYVDNVRAALEWSFGTGDSDLATSLAAEAGPHFLRLSLLTECHRWMEAAIAALDEQSRGTRREMELQASLGVSLMFTKGNSDSVRTAFEVGLAIAETIGSLERQVQLLSLLNIFHLRLGDYRAALVYAQRSESAAERLGDPTAIVASAGLIGSSLNLLGRNAEAQERLTSALRSPHARTPGRRINLGFNYRGHALISLALTLWFRGYADQAVEVADQTIEEASQTGHPTGLCLALLYAASVRMWARDYGRAEQHIAAFIEHARRHSLTPYLASGLGMKAEIAVFSGRAAEGVDVLRRALATLRSDRYAMRAAIFSTCLAQGLTALGRFNEALETIEAEIQRAEQYGDLVGMPEMFRIKGDTIAYRPGADVREAEAVLRQSLELARSQSALSLELRTAMSLARLWVELGREREARQLLESVYNRFTEGFGTADLQAAKRMLEGFGRSTPAPTPSSPPFAA